LEQQVKGNGAHKDQRHHMKTHVLIALSLIMSISLHGMERTIVPKGDSAPIPTSWDERPLMPLEHDVHSLKTLCLDTITHDRLDYDAAPANIKLLIEQALCAKFGVWSDELTTLAEHHGLDGPLFVLYGLPANLTPEMVKAHHEGSQTTIQRASKKDLSRLDLRNLDLLFVPIDTTPLTRCRTLYLSNNQLTSIDTAPPSLNAGLFILPTTTSPPSIPPPPYSMRIPLSCQQPTH